jgi:hypothetical protein
LLLFKILGRLGMRRPLISSVYGRRFRRRRVVGRSGHVLRNLVSRSNVVAL